MSVSLRSASIRIVESPPPPDVPSAFSTLPAPRGAPPIVRGFDSSLPNWVRIIALNAGYFMPSSPVSLSIAWLAYAA